MRPEPDPVWSLFRRRTFSRLAYWCQVLGYDLRDRSLTNRFYFAYFLLFWMAWVVVVFALLGSALAGLVKRLEVADPSALAVFAGAFVLAAWGLVQLWQAGGRSPFVFNQPDAFLLCQAPVDRRKVGLAWFLMDWFVTVLPFAAASILLAFALTEAALPHAASFRDLPGYLAASLRALAAVVPLQMGLQAGLWGLGAWRLRRDRPPRRRPGPRLAALALGLGLGMVVFLPGWGIVFLAPLTFPLGAAFAPGLAPSAWLLRAGLGLLVLGIGLAVLLAWSGRMQLGRAAQETRLQAVLQEARGLMNFELADVLQRQGRMKATRPPSRLPVPSGAWTLAWKDLVQSQRALRLGQALRWAWIFLLGLGIFLAPGWVAQTIVGAFWAVALGNQVNARLRSDLARWWLLRSLPLRTDGLLLAELGPACGLGVALGWLGLALAAPPAPLGWLAAALLPFLAASAALGTARDILDHARARVLMTPSLAEENVPRQDIGGVLTVLAAAGFPLGLLAWGAAHPGGLAWALLSLPAAALIAVTLFQSVRLVYRWMK